MPKVTRPSLPDATELLRQMRAGERSAESVVAEHLDRIERTQPSLNAAAAVLRDEALAEARAPRPGPLSGLPISVKETFGIAGHKVTAGSNRMQPWYHDKDSAVVHALREAGAIVVARSNVPELAMAGETDNLRFGRTNNALDPTRAAGGSSGGEGVLVASGGSAAGVGSDILGSIRIPTAFNGIVGFKPASAAVDKRGTWPQIPGTYLDTWLGIGPITRSVRDARLLYDIIARHPAAPPAALDGVRLIIPRDFYLELTSPAIERALVRARTVLEASGMRPEEHAFSDIRELYTLLQQQVVIDLEQPLLNDLHREGEPPFSRLRELVNQLRRRPTIYSGLFQLLAVAPVIRPRASRAAAMVARFEAARRHYRSVLGQDGVLLLPAIGTLAPPHGAMNRDSLRPGVNGKMTAMTFCNSMDLPSITVPAWREQDGATGLPPAIMLAAAPGAEGALLDAAAALEAGIS